MTRTIGLQMDDKLCWFSHAGGKRRYFPILFCIPKALDTYLVLLAHKNLALAINGVTEGVDDTTKEGGANRISASWLVCLTVSLSLIRQLLLKIGTLTLSASKLRHMPCTPDENSTTSADPMNK